MKARAALLGVIVAASCGRVGFGESSSDAGDAGDDAPRDGDLDAPDSATATAPMFVQAGGGFQTSSTMVTGTFPGNITLGDLIVVELDTIPAVPINNNAITDSLGNTYTILAGQQGPAGLNDVSFFAYAIASSTGFATITVTTNQAATQLQVYLAEYANIDPVTPYDMMGLSLSDGPSTPGNAASEVTTTEPNQLLVNLLLCSGPCTEGDAQFALRSSMSANVFQDRVAPTPGLYRAQGTSPTSWMSTTLSFHPK